MTTPCMSPLSLVVPNWSVLSVYLHKTRISCLFISCAIYFRCSLLLRVTAILARFSLSCYCIGWINTILLTYPSLFTLLSIICHRVKIL